MISRYERFAFAVSGLQRSLHKIASDEMEKYGLRGSFALYLMAMSRHPEGVTSAQLREICDKDKAAVSRAIAEMEDFGLVERRGKQYRAQLFLTNRGRDAADFVRARALLAVEAAGQGLTDDNREIFYASLELISNNLQEIEKNGIPEKEAYNENEH